jgi:hypothetical protein
MSQSHPPDGTARNKQPITIALLGPFTIWSPPTAGASRLNAKEKSLLAYLALHKGRLVARETLRRLLWSDSSDTKGRHSLSQALYVMSRALPNWLHCNNAHITVALNSLVTDIDVAKTYAAEGKLTELSSLLRGEFLSDVTSGAPEFEDWKDTVQRDLFREIEVRVAEAAQRCPDEHARRVHESILNLTGKMPDCILLREVEQALYARISRLPKDLRDQEVQKFEEITSIPFLGRKKELDALCSFWKSACSNRDCWPNSASRRSKMPV